MLFSPDAKPEGDAQGGGKQIQGLSSWGKKEDPGLLRKGFSVCITASLNTEIKSPITAGSAGLCRGAGQGGTSLRVERSWPDVKPRCHLSQGPGRKGTGCCGWSGFGE